MINEGNGDTVVLQTNDVAVRFANLLLGMSVSQAIYVAAELRIADVLSEGECSITDLAQRIDADGASLQRVMRALASVGIFVEVTQDRYDMTPMAWLLVSDSPVSLRGWAIEMGEEWHWTPWAHLLHSVRTGETGFGKTHGREFFDHVESDSHAADVFNTSMTTTSAARDRVVLRAYDFSDISTIVDVGGGHGQFLTAILRRYPNMHGTLFETAAVAEGAREKLEETEVAERCEVLIGDFFSELPSGADAYLLAFVAHDWVDADAGKILRRCREAMAPNGRVLLVDVVIPDDGRAHPGKLLDLLMLTHFGGRERTESEFAALFASAGLKLNGVTQTRGGIWNVIEAVAG